MVKTIENKCFRSTLLRVEYRVIQLIAATGIKINADMFLESAGTGVKKE